MRRNKKVSNKAKALKKQKLPFDKNFFYLVLSLVVVGLVFVADISAPQALTYFDDKFHFVKQQAIAAAVGVIAMIIVSNVKYSFWKKFTVPFFGFSIILLIAVLIPGISYSALGARRWISVGGFNFQPSEVVKLSLALYLAKVSEANKKSLSYFIPLAIVVGLIMLQPDLGTTLVIVALGMSQILVSEIPWREFTLSVAVGVLGVVGSIFISPYRRDRMITFFENTKDPLGKAYHIRQILLAIGSGGIFGVGLGQSKQKYLFLPEASTDSIFAAIAEEIGLIGSLVIIFVFLYFVFCAFKIATNAPDKFSKVMAVGIASWIGGQALLNFSSMVALTPLTGIPLPFFSFGGTSLVTVLVGCGILLNISRYETKKITSRR